MRRFILVTLLALSACSDRIDAPLVPDALSVGSPQPVFVATNREENPPGTFGIERSADLRTMRMLVSIPPERDIGTISDGQARPNPAKDFALAERTEFATKAQFQGNLRQAIGRSGGREVVVFVHGYNNSFADAAFRMAQLAHDLHIDAPVISFSWPSRGNPLGYQYDIDSAFYSRDSLAELLLHVRAAGSDRIILVAHSMGGQLAMETLRTIALSKPGWAAENLGGVMLIQPDVNLDLFREQTDAFSKWPQPFVVFASKNDRVLRFSGGLRGDDRQLGRLSDVTEISDLPVLFVDVSSFNDGTEHFVTGTSESFIRLLNSSDQMGDAFLNGESPTSVPILGASRVIGNSVSIILHPGDR